MSILNLGFEGYNFMAKIQVTQNGKVLVTQNGGVLLSNTSELATKTITENGTYLASSDNVDGYSEVTVNVSGSGGEYQLRRVTDDSNNEIGTAFMQFTDSSNDVYDVVCLDAQYRLASGQWCSSTGTVTNMPLYYNQTIWEAKETATTNTQLILDYCTADSYTSTACSHCRSQSFTINGTIYYGQLPNIIELVRIFMKRTAINIADITASSYSSLVIPISTRIWSSSQYISSLGWCILNTGTVGSYMKINDVFVCPVLEIPA